MLPLLQMHKLYEYYVLSKLCCYFQANHFDLISCNDYAYKDHNLNQSASNANTFYFVRGSISVTIYYEPYINGKYNISDNDINLFRNTSVSLPLHYDIDTQRDLDGEAYNASQGTYYLPDYVIKIQYSDHSDYIMLDAKFSMRGVALKNYLPSLAYKYLFSISPLHDEDKIIGLCLINGKSLDVDDSIYNAYDLSPTTNKIRPFAKVLTLTENSTSNALDHQKLISEVLGLNTIY